MKFTRESSSALRIRSVSGDGIRIGETHYTGPLALTAEAMLPAWPEKNIADLVEDDFAAILADNPEVVVLGTGKTNVFPPRELVFAMARRGVGLEVMDTAAAARTFNVLASEERKVAAVLYV